MRKQVERVQRVEGKRWKFERDAEKAAARAAIPAAPTKVAPPDDPIVTAGREVLSVVEAAEFLGLSRDTVRNYANAGVIPSRRVGDRLLFSRTAIVRWLQNAG